MKKETGGYKDEKTCIDYGSGSAAFGNRRERKRGRIKEIVLSEFEAWNDGAWDTWADQYCTESIVYTLDNKDLTLEEAKTELTQKITDLNAKRVRLDNLIVSGDWAGVHYWNVITDENGEAQPMDTMTFMHFVNTADGVKVDMCNVNQGF